MICPNQCVCMQSPFMDLSIARWIQDVKHDAARDAARDASPANENEVHSRLEGANRPFLIVLFHCRHSLRMTTATWITIT